MSQALAIKDDELFRKAALTGDLSTLTEDERWIYYQAYCNYLGLDPMSRPFDLLTQKERDGDGHKIRVKLYPNSSCSAQLARMHKISYGTPRYEYNEALKIIFCFVTLKFPNGREFTGESMVDKSGKSGSYLENALKKAATQARRRATLQACGVALPDENETPDIPNATTSEFVLPVQTVTEAHLKIVNPQPQIEESEELANTRDRLRRFWPENAENIFHEWFNRETASKTASQIKAQFEGMRGAEVRDRLASIAATMAEAATMIDPQAPLDSVSDPEEMARLNAAEIIEAKIADAERLGVDASDIDIAIKEHTMGVILQQCSMQTLCYLDDALSGLIAAAKAKG